MPDQSTLFPHSPADEQLEGDAPIALSIASIARSFEVSRESVRAWLDSVGAQPIATKNTYQLFTLRDAVRGFRHSGEIPIDKLPPAQRLAAYKAIQISDRIALDRKQLCRVEDVREELSRILKIVVRELEVGGDEIERDCGCPPQVLEAIENKFDRIRVQIHAAIVSNPDEHRTPRPSESDAP